MNELVRRLLLPGCLVAMDTAWLYPWSLLLARWFGLGETAPLLSAPAVVALLALARLATRGARRSMLRARLARLLVVGAGVVAVGLAVAIESRPERWVAAAFFGLLLWWRGVLAGRGRVGADQVEGTFKLGLGVLVGFLAVAAATVGDDYHALQATVGPFVLAFFFVGLLAMAVARVIAVREQSQARQGRAPALSRQWVGVLVGVVVVMLAGALLAAELLTFDLIGAIWRPVGAVLSIVLLGLLLLIAVPIALAIDGLYRLFRWLVGDVPPAARPEENGLAGFMRQLAQARREPVVLPPGLQEVLWWLGIGLAGVLALAALWQAVRWWNDQERDDEVDEERDSVWSWTAARLVVVDWLRGLLARLGRRPRSGAVPVVDGQAAGTAATAPTVASIRQVYREALAAAAALGRPRGASATPYEHLPRMQGALDPDEDVALITGAYVRTRYGRGVPQEGEVRAVRQSWERVRAGTSKES